MDFRRAATLDADLFAASVVDSIQALMRKNLKLALADCDQHLRTDPGDYFSYLRRGVIARLLGRREEARADWERCARSFDGGEDAVLAVFIIGKCGDAGGRCLRRRRGRTPGTPPRPDGRTTAAPGRLNIPASRIPNSRPPPVAAALPRS